MVTNVSLDNYERPGSVSREAGIRISLDGGCGLDDCNCSPRPFVTVSDGHTLLTVDLSPEEVDYLLRTHSLSTF